MPSNDKNLIKEMTLEEKASLCSGLNAWYTKPIERLGIPSIMVADGPHGLRKEKDYADQVSLNESLPATCFPTASALAATWNRDLIEQVGAALGKECRQEKVSVILGPGINIKRSPLCGRNFEYFSEDPYLSGEMAKSHIRGVQSQGVGTSLKHYAANNQEYRRMTIDAIIDQRALHEIYLAGFEIAVSEAQPWTLMGAYNKLNGTYCCEHPALLKKLLKEKWGHTGLVMTDWGAMNDRVAALKAGLALEMPGPSPENDQAIVKAVRHGELDESVLNQAAEQILNLVFKAQNALSKNETYDADAHHQLARQVAAEGIVLLKNDRQVLPISPGSKVALLGAFAKTPRYQGAGSSSMNPTQLDNLYDEMVKIADDQNITFAPGYHLRSDAIDETLLEAAVQVARDADAVVINIGLPDTFEVEGLDREHLRLPESHNRLVEAVCAVQSKVIIVLSNGAPVEMPWVSTVPAILEGYLGGQAGAGAIADVLFGKVNPSGKLAETFPLRLEDTPSHAYFPGGPKTVEYRESLYVGYRFYETVQTPVLFPFGHGLTYTTFTYEAISTSQPEITDQDKLTVNVTVRNTGLTAGKEVVQLYISPKEPTAFRPKLELKGFEKLSLQPGESGTVSFRLGQRAFAFYNTELGDWQVETDTYHILVGASSRQIHLQADVTVRSSQPDQSIPLEDCLPVYKNFPSNAVIQHKEFESLLGKPLPVNQITPDEPATINKPISDMQYALTARILKRIIEKQALKVIGDDINSPNAQMVQAMLKDAPLRTIIMFGGAAFNQGMGEGLLKMINGQFLKGLILLLRSRRKERKF